MKDGPEKTYSSDETSGTHGESRHRLWTRLDGRGRVGCRRERGGRPEDGSSSPTSRLSLWLRKNESRTLGRWSLTVVAPSLSPVTSLSDPPLRRLCGPGTILDRRSHRCNLHPRPTPPSSFPSTTLVSLLHPNLDPFCVYAPTHGQCLPDDQKSVT